MTVDGPATAACGIATSSEPSRALRAAVDIAKVVRRARRDDKLSFMVFPTSADDLTVGERNGARVTGAWSKRSAAHNCAQTPNAGGAAKNPLQKERVCVNDASGHHTAETEGFEPSVPLRELHLSRVVH